MESFSSGYGSVAYTSPLKSDKTLELVGATALPATICNGFICVNTHHPIAFEGRPSDGSTLKPGAVDAWELKYGFQETHAAELKYKVLGTDAIVTYTIETSTYTNDSACKVTPPSAGKCTAGGLQLTFAKG